MKQSKNESKKENSLRNLKRFGIEKPALSATSEQKKAGWERRRERQRMADRILHFKDLDYAVILEIRNLFKKSNKTAKDYNRLKKLMKLNKITLGDVHLFTYAYSEKYILDWIDRNLEKAPIKTELTGEGGASININIIETNNGDPDKTTTKTKESIASLI